MRAQQNSGGSSEQGMQVVPEYGAIIANGRMRKRKHPICFIDWLAGCALEVILLRLSKMNRASCGGKKQEWLN